MTTNRTKLTQPIVRTREQLEILIGQIADLTIQRNQLQLALDEEIRIARDAFEARITALNKSLDEKTQIAQGWAENNPEEFGGKKSLDTLHGTLGFRTGTPKLKTLAGWTWDRVLDTLRILKQRDYIRGKEEVAKDLIIAAHPETLDDLALRAIGCRVVQDESFFVEPNLTETSNRVTTEAA